MTYLEDQIVYKFLIYASVKDVWHKLSTEEGLKSFFSPNVSAEFKVGGKFEILFDMEQPKGMRGSEGMRILSIERESMLSFTWNAPVSIPLIRGQMTVVQIYLSAVEGACELTFINSGYGLSKDWKDTRNYFLKAWGAIVLPRLKYACEVKNIDWQNLDQVSLARIE